MMNNLTFSGGGIDLKDQKQFSMEEPIEKASLPEYVHIPLLQGIGVECTPTVKKGDQVKVGQVIGQLDAGLGATVHASVSGEVVEIGKRYTTEGKKVKCVTIKNDGEDEKLEFVSRFKAEGMTIEEYASIAKDAGVVGMGGAGFPLGVKLSGAAKDKVDSVIANGAECEPYLTTDYRVMLEQPKKVVGGLKLVMEAVGAEFGYIGIEDNKPEAIETIDGIVSNDDDITVASLITKYPQGDSTRLIDSVLDRKTPIGERSGAVKATVCNVGTLAAFNDAVYEGKPVYERVVSVTGPGIKNPKNLVVRIGTPVSHLIEECGGFTGKIGAVIAGGPMSGNQVYTLELPITKSITGITVLLEEDVDLRPVTPCIKCGRCVKACPVHLMPYKIEAAVKKEKFDVAKDLDVEECIQCGTCSYVCPAKRELSADMNLAKNVIYNKNI